MDPHYCIDRCRQVWYEHRYPGLPWFTRQANTILAEWLKPTDVGFEWGSGRSTIWLAQRVHHLTSVEHDRSWAERVRERLSSSGLDAKTDYFLESDVDEVSSPDSKYVARIHDISDGSLDFCVVDGWSRADCALACIAKLKAGGLLILDNAQLYIPRREKTRAVCARAQTDGFPRPSNVWAEFHAVVANWRCIWTTSGLSDTALYVKHTLS